MENFIIFVEQHAIRTTQNKQQMARDLIHYSIKRALEKDGWVITDDPLTVISEQTKFFIDIGAKKFVTAKKGKEEIAVEIKTFGYSSILEPFYSALGKYLVYKKALEDILSTRKLFLGISKTTYFRINQIPIFKNILTSFEIKIIIVDVNKEKILQWIR